MTKNGKKTAKKATKAAEARPAAPKWGTVEWIVAHPYSKMDRKRRARVEKVVGEKKVKEIMKGPHIYCVFSRMVELVQKYGNPFCTADRKVVARAIQTARDYEVVLYDVIFALELGKAWNIGEADVSGNICFAYRSGK